MGELLRLEKSISPEFMDSKAPRARAFFADAPKWAPDLNKITLVKWLRSYAYISLTHMLLSRSLNQMYDTVGGEVLAGLLLHTKYSQ